MPNVKLIKGTVVEGMYQHAKWEGEVSEKTYKTLLSSKKIEPIEKDEEVAVSIEVDVKNSEEFKQMQKEIEFYKEERAAANKFYSELIESLKKCTNIQCVKELLEAESSNNGEADDA